MQETGDSYRDTVALTVRCDGVDIPPFFILHTYKNAAKASGRRCIAGEDPVKGMNIPRMKEYIDHIKLYVHKPSILVMDRLSSHTSLEVRRYIESQKLPNGEQMFKVMLLPAKTAFLISPLDMGSIAAFKAYYHKLERRTPEEKKRATQSAWDSVSNAAIRNICLNCGITGEESLHSIRSRFLKEVIGLVPRQVADYADFYDSWSSGAVKVEGAKLHRGVVYEEPQQLGDCELDGDHWVHYG